MEFFGISRGVSLAMVLLVMALISVAIFFFVRSAPPRTITMTTGPEGSMFHTNAWKFAAILASNGVTLRILTSHGSLENLNRLTDDSLHVDVGLVQSGVTNAGMGKLLSLGEHFLSTTADLLSRGAAGIAFWFGGEARVHRCGWEWHQSFVIDAAGG